LEEISEGGKTPRRTQSAAKTQVADCSISAPKFLDNAMTLGEVMQEASAFASVQHRDHI
jgi:hypothetical protein